MIRDGRMGGGGVDGVDGCARGRGERGRQRAEETYRPCRRRVDLRRDGDDWGQPSAGLKKSSRAHLRALRRVILVASRRVTPRHGDRHARFAAHRCSQWQATPPSQHTPILSVPDAANDDYFPSPAVDCLAPAMKGFKMKVSLVRCLCYRLRSRSHSSLR